MSNLLGLVNNLLKSVAFFALVFAALFFFFLYFFVGNLLGFFIFLFLRFRGFCGSGAIGRLVLCAFRTAFTRALGACLLGCLVLACCALCLREQSRAAINDAKTKNSFKIFIFFLFADKYLSVLQVYINGCFYKHLYFFYSFLKPIKYSTFPSPPFMGDSISPTSFASLKFAST